MCFFLVNPNFVFFLRQRFLTWGICTSGAMWEISRCIPNKTQIHSNSVISVTMCTNQLVYEYEKLFHTFNKIIKTSFILKMCWIIWRNDRQKVSFIFVCCFILLKGYEHKLRCDMTSNLNQLIIKRHSQK